MKKILVAYHTLSGNTERMAKAVAEGARSVDDVEVEFVKAGDVSIEAFRKPDAFAFGTPDYFSYMAGMVKDMFDRVFYEVKSAVEEKPCICFVTHGGGGKAAESMRKICESFRFKMVDDVLSVKSPVLDEHLEQAKNLGKKLAESVK